MLKSCMFSNKPDEGAVLQLTLAGAYSEHRFDYEMTPSKNSVPQGPDLLHVRNEKLVH